MPSLKIHYLLKIFIADLHIIHPKLCTKYGFVTVKYYFQFVYIFIVFVACVWGWCCAVVNHPFLSASLFLVRGTHKRVCKQAERARGLSPVRCLHANKSSLIENALKAFPANP